MLKNIQNTFSVQILNDRSKDNFSLHLQKVTTVKAILTKDQLSGLMIFSDTAFFIHLCTQNIFPILPC